MQVVIDHYDLFMHYAHMSRMDVSPADRAASGQTTGLVGISGNPRSMPGSIFILRLDLALPGLVRQSTPHGSSAEVVDDMDIKTAFFLLLALLVGCHKQFAVNDSNGSAADSSYAFGEIRLLSDANEITARYKNIGNCLLVDGILADCKYHDWNGTIYAVFEGKVVRIEADRAFLKKGTRLPFDLALGDDRALVLKKLLRHRNVAGIEALLAGLKSGEKNVAVAVENERPGGDGFQFFLVFDDGDDLRTVGSMVTVI